MGCLFACFFDQVDRIDQTYDDQIDQSSKQNETPHALSSAGRRTAGLQPAPATTTVRLRTIPYGSDSIGVAMPTIKAEEVRIPRQAREAVARHEEVIVLNRERPAFVIVHPDDHGHATPPRLGRPLREALTDLAQAAPPDPGFAEDMEAVLKSVGPLPADPWALS
jgi:hypothetical protein